MTLIGLAVTRTLILTMFAIGKRNCIIKKSYSQPIFAYHSIFTTLAIISNASKCKHHKKILTRYIENPWTRTPDDIFRDTKTVYAIMNTANGSGPMVL